MPVVASDVIPYSALNRPLDDVSLGGGGIDVTCRPVFTQLTGVDDLEVSSTAAGDTGVLTIVGRDVVGELATIGVNLAGVLVVPITTILERVLSISYAATPTGTLVVRRRPAGAVVAVIPSGEKAVSMMFKSALAEAVQAVRYDKFFFKNVHGSLTLSSAVVRLTADPAAKIRIGLATTLDDTQTIANRKTAPAGISFFNDNVDINLPGGQTLPAGQAIGVWVEQDLAAAEAAINSTFTVQITGTS